MNKRIDEICDALDGETDINKIRLLVSEIRKETGMMDFKYNKKKAEIWELKKEIYGLKKTIENKSKILDKMGIRQGRKWIK